MKAASRPFQSKHPGRCPICKLRITEGQSIVKLENPVTWIATKRLIPHGGGRFFTDRQSSQYAHDECINEKEQEDE